MVNCWFGARWFGILRVPLSINPFHKEITGIQTTGPQINNLPLAKEKCAFFGCVEKFELANNKNLDQTKIKLSL